MVNYFFVDLEFNALTFQPYLIKSPFRAHVHLQVGIALVSSWDGPMTVDVLSQAVGAEVERSIFYFHRRSE